MLSLLLRAVLRFRLVLVGAALGLIVLGVMSLRQMHNDVVPELASGPVLEVQTEALGLSSSEVEQYVTVPEENNLLDGVMGVWDVRSHSIPGLATVDLYFEPGITELHARQLVEERLTNAFSLPNVSKPPVLIQPLSSTSRVLMIGLSSRTIDPLELSYLARWVVKPRLSGVQGVANVAIFGQQDRQIQVEADPSKMAAHHVTLQQIIDTAGNAQLVSPLSYLEGAAPGTGGFIDGPNQRLEIRPVLPLGAPKDLASVPVSDAPGKLPLGDVADVIQGHQPLIGSAITKQGAGLILMVQKLPRASVRGTTNGVLRALSELRPALGGVTVDTSFFRPATYETNALHNVAIALAIAAALGLLALIALLLDARAVVVCAISVAVSLLAAALVLQALGYTLNALVVLGLVMASVVLVDDAVGSSKEIVERMRSRSAAGAPVPVQEAIIEGYTQMRGVLVYGTLIVLLTIAPVFFAKGLTATYLHPMALAFSLAVIVSTLITFTITPALGMVLFDRGRVRGRPVVLSWIGDVYARGAGLALAIPRAALAAVLAIGVAGLVAFPFLQQPRPPRFLDRNLVVNWDGPTGASLREMDRITSRVTTSLRSLPSVSDVAATLGRAVSADRIVDTSSGQIFVAIKGSADYGKALSAVVQVVQTVPGMHAAVTTYEGDVQSGVLAPSTSDLTVRVYGEDYNQLRKLAAQMQSLLRHVGGLGASQIHLPTEAANIKVAIDDTKAHDAGVLPGDARRQASTLVSGLTVGNFFQQQAVFDVVVVGTPSERVSLDTMRDLPIDTAGGGHVPLSSIATLSVTPIPIDVEHEALSRYVDVTAPVHSGSVGAARSAINRLLPQISFPLNYHAEVVGATPERPTSHLTFLSFVLAALIGILLLFQAAFRSWRLAAVLLLALPASLIGGVVVALATGAASSLGADAGLLAVFAFAARQGLLQVASIRRVHAEDGGELTRELVLEGAAERRGQAVASAVVLAAVLIPFAVIGDVAGNEITHTTAAVVLGGLITATLLTEVFVPALCLAFGPAEAAVAEHLHEDVPMPAPSPTTS
jgi:Cu/Ag efflux pump CusA